ncbi:MAG: YibE/F family protein [Patescibacteria group bacterium]
MSNDNPDLLSKIKGILILTVFLFIFYPWGAFAAPEPMGSIPKDEMFKAEVVEILDEQEKVSQEGLKTTQQDLKLKGLEGEYKGEEFVFEGIDDLTVLSNKTYRKGQEVWAAATYKENGEPVYYVVDHVRNSVIWWLAGIFVLALLLVGGFKGFRALMALTITFAVLVLYIVPTILKGVNPLLPTLVGSTIILLVVIYLTEGFRLRSHIAILSTFFSLLVTIIFSWVFVEAAKLTGVTSHEVSSLVNLGEGAINFQGLLLAGIIIGALGVLDDVIISQVATVEQIMDADRYQRKWEVFKRAYKVGVSHISSMTNTLFLAYAGASLPLLILFISGDSAFTGWTQVISNEVIATEIVRTLTGSIGLILAVPISTGIAVWWLKMEDRGER